LKILKPSRRICWSKSVWWYNLHNWHQICIFIFNSSMWHKRI